MYSFLFGIVQFPYGYGVEAVSESVRGSFERRVPPARGLQVEKVVSRMGRVFQDVGWSAQAARAEDVLQGGQCATCDFLGRIV